MGMKEYLDKRGVTLKPRSSWWVTRLMGRFGQSEWWMTIGKTIYHPDDLEDPYEHTVTIKHELTHVAQFGRMPDWLYMFLYLFVPLPIGLAYFRWRWEREAYLHDIKAGAKLERVVDVLWRGYLFTWPRSLMTRWFKKQLKKRGWAL